MTDPVEERPRDGLRSAPLPVAPETLRDYLADLPMVVQPARPVSRRPALVEAAAVVVLAVGIGTLVLTGSSSTGTPTAPIGTVLSVGSRLRPTDP
jgi:hypothetical protein